MSQIIFRLTEAMARYKVSVNALSDELGISKSSIAHWRSGKTKPGLDRINEILVALVKIGDPEQLQALPLRLSDVLEWRVHKDENLN
ncbi:helix-turn-helix transcriptional regulator [Leptothoe sp. ISB3NOV94-8A]|uniref:XRE family transcriptional regulator n=1 Tax=Adonisia turfae CCMR0081 TaxID=2292702 RepID=A0A6M0RMV7_9CYAN|nr:helix-turn-helix transcriptional regulator [Adonisia turfae]NEZ57190.1 XRE family transcriptional regulator [Adonisia turfae CCMR0081]